MARRKKQPVLEETKQERDYRLASETGERQNVRQFIRYVDRVCVSFGGLTPEQVEAMPFEERYALWCGYITAYNRAQAGKRRAAKYASETHFTMEDIRDLWAVYEGKCAYCRRSLNYHKWHVEHVIPLSRGGSDGPENLVLACERCNLNKGAKTPEEWTNRWYITEAGVWEVKLTGSLWKWAFMDDPIKADDETPNWTGYSGPDELREEFEERKAAYKSRKE